jgi:hypothetical protein
VFFGRSFSAADLQVIGQIVTDFPALSLTELSRTVCEVLSWKRPSGRLKDQECRQMLERLQNSGLLNLPGVRRFGPKGPQTVDPTDRGKAHPEISGSPGEFEPLSLQLVVGEGGNNGESKLWRELIARYHYLGYRVAVGARVGYLVRSAQCESVLACLQWSSPAWKMAARDRWIGWNEPQRKRNLQRVVNNSRFLILPWVRIKGLASKILSLCARRLPADWERLYGARPLLMETLVSEQRFTGTCYRAANWIELGLTAGRGRMDRHHLWHNRSVKRIYVYPLCRNVQKRLCDVAGGH